eukprot:4469893-Ditylum_brightwellii.AAC.1
MELGSADGIELGSDDGISLINPDGIGLLSDDGVELIIFDGIELGSKVFDRYDVALGPCPDNEIELGTSDWVDMPSE